MNIIQKLRNVSKNKKGFTLVELIVVLVILAILLAILVPGLITWIQRARDRQVIVDARTVYLSAQTILTEQELGLGGGGTIAVVTNSNGRVNGAGAGADVAELAALTKQYEASVPYNGQSEVITGMTYTDVARGKTATLTISPDGANWAVSDAR
ncbi:MAG: type II secretion system GspH family protein [Lachnospiraceae bacterium]|nr:type II secretion system GspH family protein [Lachnospiraceae bacterium]